MPRVGFIQDKFEVKFLILYVASRLIAPAPFEGFQELCMCDDGVDFFEFSECLSDLVHSQHLTLSDDGLYAVTDKGRRNGAIWESSLPYSVRLRADQGIGAYNQQLRRQAQIRARVTPRGNGTFTVTLTLCDEQDSPILDLSLMVPQQGMANELAARFKKNAEQMYTDVIGTLFPQK